ncbi:MAG: HAMP domain-containing histidine kinase [Chloroflexi bacterium]|nr:HAMP domain-containing histidine kinase [Chloroflexota bacterium]MCC6896082.1 HAMP domain-containing histidine kinase [Anaerolineae bacterium]
MTIRRKLILLYAGLIAIVIIFFGLGVFSVIRATWIETVDATLRETADQVIKNSDSYPVGEFGAPTRIVLVLPQLDIFRASNILVQAWAPDAEGHFELRAQSDNLRDYAQPLDQNALMATTAQVTTVKKDNAEVRVMTVPLRVTGQENVFGLIQVADSLDTVNQATSRLSLFMLGGGILAVLASLGLGYWLSDQTLRPIEALTEAADNIATAKDLETRLTWNGPMDELGRLTVVFNRMMDRLEHLFTAQRRLVADVSHELRTPLTAIRGNLDLVRRYGMDDTSLEAMHSEAERMSRMVDDLLLLARADYGNLVIDMTEIDADTVVTDVFKEARILAKDRNLLIRIHHIEPVRLKGNSDRLKQLLLNLVSNAIKFTPDGGQIGLSLRQAGREAVFQVSDTGVGIEAEDIAHIFDRFYQADTSRTRVTNSGGAGLGLSIAKWIVEAHGGTIEVKSRPNIETVFTVRIPTIEQTFPLVSEDGQSYSSMALQKLGLSRRKTPVDGMIERR